MKYFLLLIAVLGIGAFYLNQLPDATQKAVDIIRAKTSVQAQALAGINYLSEVSSDGYKFLLFKMDSLVNWVEGADYLCKNGEIRTANDRYSECLGDSPARSLYAVGKMQSFEYFNLKKSSFKVIHFDFVANVVRIQFFDK